MKSIDSVYYVGPIVALLNSGVQTDTKRSPAPNELYPRISTDGIISVSDLLTDDPDELASKCLRTVPRLGLTESAFKGLEGSVLIAGDQFGMGSSREQAVVALQKSGIQLVVAPSFGPIFERNATNLGLATSTNTGIIEQIIKGAPISLTDIAKDKNDLSRRILEAGGLFESMRRIKNGSERFQNSPDTQHPMNLWEKRIAKSASRKGVTAGDYFLLNVDTAYTYVGLSGLARQALMDNYGKVQISMDPNKICAFEDHFAHSPDKRIAALETNQREFMLNEIRIPDSNYYYGKQDHGGGKGICHRVMVEKIDPRASQVICCTDSHTPTLGVLPILPFPVGSTGWAAAISEGSVLVEVPKVVKIKLTGALKPGLSIRDAQLQMARTMKVDPSCMIEFQIDQATLSFDQITALCNMVPEVFNVASAITGFSPALAQHLEQSLGISFEEASNLYDKPDDKCTYEKEFSLDLSECTPWIAKPGSPNNSVPLNNLDEHPKIQKAYLVSCTLGLDDLIEAAAVAKGQKFKTQLIIVPSSDEIRIKAERMGVLQILRDSGAIVVDESACGPCIGAGLGSLEQDEIGISASNRNFPGRMGHNSAKVFLGGPQLTTACAIAGEIVDEKTYNDLLLDYDSILKTISEKN